MQILWLTNGDKIELIRAMKLEQGYSLLLVRDAGGERVQLFAADEIDHIETVPDPEAKVS